MAFAGVARAAIIEATGVDRTAVLAALSSARDGDIVRLPPGTSQWDTTVQIDKAVILQGAGIGSTIITDGIPVGQHLIVITLVPNRVTRITGIEFRPGNRAVSNYLPLIQLNGSPNDNRRIRIDHCKFTEIWGSILNVESALGVIDNNTIIGRASGIPAFVGYVKGSTWGGDPKVNIFGDGAWGEPDNFGTDRFIFFEDNVITSLYGNITIQDCQAGGRYVYRHNTITGGSFESHGLEAARERSGRAFEIYNNTFLGNNSRTSPVYMRGGVGVIHNNVIGGWTNTPRFSLLNNRSRDELASPFGGSDGRNPWDVNDSNNPYVVGRASAVGTLTVTDNSRTWTANEWAGHIVRRTSGKLITGLSRAGATLTVTCPSHGFAKDDRVSIFGANEWEYNNLYRIIDATGDQFTVSMSWATTRAATGTVLACRGNHFSEIVSNTATQLTFKDSIYGAMAQLVFASNDTFEINKIVHAMDQVGRSQGTNLAGVDLPIFPQTWNNQATSPWYEWGNVTDTGADVNFLPDAGVIRENVHFLNNTIKPDYKPYEYPHPLRKPAAPSDLRLSQP